MTTPPTASALAAAFDAARSLDAPVNVRLSHYAAALSAHMPNYMSAADRLVARLNAAGSGAHAPAVGDAMPEFLLPDQTGRLVSLADVTAKGPAAIAFHRGHWCPFCRINAHALAELETSTSLSGGQVVLISPERQHYTTEQRTDAKATFLALSDISNGYALSLNIAIWLGDDLKRIHSEAGRDLPAYHGNDSWFVPIPATFVVARNGRVVARFIDPDYRRRMDLDDLRQAMEAAAHCA